MIPAVITLEDLKMRITNTEFIEYYCAAVRASLDSFQDLIDTPNTVLTTSQQVIMINNYELHLCIFLRA